MYIINITINDDLTEQQHNELFPIHVKWFKKHFQAGKFLILGPYTDTTAHSGVIFAVTKTRAELDQILAEDCYYPSLAHYEVREFNPRMIATNMADFIHK